MRNLEQSQRVHHLEVHIMNVVAEIHLLQLYQQQVTLGVRGRQHHIQHVHQVVVKKEHVVHVVQHKQVQ